MHYSEMYIKSFPEKGQASYIYVSSMYSTDARPLQNTLYSVYIPPSSCHSGPKSWGFKNLERYHKVRPWYCVHMYWVSLQYFRNSAPASDYNPAGRSRDCHQVKNWARILDNSSGRDKCSTSAVNTHWGGGGSS